jgi:hypothetical protein
MRSVLMRSLPDFRPIDVRNNILVHPSFIDRSPDYKIRLSMREALFGTNRYIVDFYVRLLGASDPSFLSTHLRKIGAFVGDNYVDGVRQVGLKSAYFYVNRDQMPGVLSSLFHVFRENSSAYYQIHADNIVQYSRSEAGPLFA